ncbi:hypothetical protein C8Q78DRAFT_1010883 [Trametes maxima]|nr:hypothetical protein C8Q78DRAFT_1010883 [Trametes maxima]
MRALSRTEPPRRSASVPASLYATATGDLKTRREDLRFTMHNKITCIPYKDFMDEFLPEVQPLSPSLKEAPKTVMSSIKSRLRLRIKAPAPAAASLSTRPQLPPNPFEGMLAATTEKNMYTKITAALNAADPCLGFQFVPTPHKRDQSADTKQAVD